MQLKFKFHFAMSILGLLTFVYIFLNIKLPFFIGKSVFCCYCFILGKETFYINAVLPPVPLIPLVFSFLTELVASQASRCILLMGFLGYYWMGAKIFQALEMDTQEDLKNTFTAARHALLNNVNITPEELEVFLQKLTFAVKYGVIPVVNGTIYISWELANSFTFVASTLSTIGYGVIAPRTPMGQIFCVFYGLLGIPLTIIFLKFLGKAISQPFSGLGTYLQNMGLTERQIKSCIFIFFLVTGLLIFILLPPVVFKYAEGWPYNEGLYFAFVSLSTIGFGDYIPGVSARRTYSPMYTVFMVPWYAFGLAWIALLFNLFSKLLERTKTKLNCKQLCQKEKT